MRTAEWGQREQDATRYTVRQGEKGVNLQTLALPFNLLSPQGISVRG
jgi:hypothetical protein